MVFDTAANRFCRRTRRFLPEYVVTPHFWRMAEGQILLQSGQIRWMRACRCLVTGAASIRIDGRLLRWSSGLGGARIDPTCQLIGTLDLELDTLSQ